MLFKAIIFVIYNVSFATAAIFMWSNHELSISPFEEFTTKSFLNTVEKLEKPDVYVFKSPKAISDNILPFVKGYYSIYSPNGDIEVENTIDLTGDPETDIGIIRETAAKSENFLSTIIIPTVPTKRSKRDVEGIDIDEEPNKEDVIVTEQQDEDLTTQTKTETNTSSKKPTTPPKPTGPVIYRAFKLGKNNQKVYALLYSTGPLILRRNGTESSETYLGNVDDDLIIYDTRGGDTRLNVNIPNGRGKITLRFNFTWKNGYWYLPTVKIEDNQSKNDYNLVTKDEVYASAKFSYHCNGETKFSDYNGTELVISDLQVQCDSKNGKFGDANDCVPFTTAAICSGIFITIILGIGLIIALISIMDIRTMDKFDNYKTKNLPINVIE